MADSMFWASWLFPRLFHETPSIGLMDQVLHAKPLNVYSETTINKSSIGVMRISSTCISCVQLVHPALSLLTAYDTKQMIAYIRKNILRPDGCFRPMRLVRPDGTNSFTLHRTLERSHSALRTPIPWKNLP